MPTPIEQLTILYHIGYRFPRDEALVQSLFGEVRVAIICGTSSRARKLAHCFSQSNAAQHNHCHTDRFTILLPVPTVLIATHGIGLGSADCLLNDLHQLLTFAHAPPYAFLRVGSSGGLGVPLGSVVVSRNAVNGALRPELPVTVLGAVRHLPAKLDATLSRKLYAFLNKTPALNCVMGDTLCAETFFDSQARTDGVQPLFSPHQAADYLKRCHDAGVRNIEMESLPLAAFANRVGVPAAVACVTFVDRLQDETPTELENKLMELESSAVVTITDFVKSLFVSCKVDELMVN